MSSSNSNNIKKTFNPNSLPLDVYAIVSRHKVSKEIWDRVKLLMQGTKLSLQEKECKFSSEYKVSEQSTARMEQICDGCEVG
ncbi:hypothetical protein Tco_0704453 [Tanacetum coccineum]|uniref:Uncharacterized protein n=1 Tax=Tanacetum coccineum TaxID=301880 RepID=A0ABQ4Y2J5_9ASTR